MHGSPGVVHVTKTLMIRSDSLYTVEVSLFMRSVLELLDEAKDSSSRSAGRLDILVGCNVAQGEAGAQLISDLESAYKVNVAASDDVTAAIRRAGCPCCPCCPANDMERSDMILESDGVDVTQVCVVIATRSSPPFLTGYKCAGLLRSDDHGVDRGS